MRYFFTVLVVFIGTAFFTISGATLPDVKGGAPDHRIFFEVQSSPNGVELVPPADEEGNREVFDKTRCTVPVELRWEKKYYKSVWSALSIKSPGNMVTVEYNPEIDAHVFYLAFEARKPGYQKLLHKKKVLTLYPHMINWIHASQFPTKRVVKIALDPIVKESPQEKKTDSRPSYRKVIVASSSDALGNQPGTVTLLSSPRGAQILVDGKPVARTPADLVLQEGVHRVEIRTAGHTPWRRKVRVPPLQHIEVRAELEPVP